MLLFHYYNVPITRGGHWRSGAIVAYSGNRALQGVYLGQSRLRIDAPRNASLEIAARKKKKHLLNIKFGDVQCPTNVQINVGRFPFLIDRAATSRQQSGITSV